MYKSELFGDTAWMETLECALKVMRFTARVYVNGGGGPSLGMINKELKINTGKYRVAGIGRLTSVGGSEGRGRLFLLPGF